MTRSTSQAAISPPSERDGLAPIAISRPRRSRSASDRSERGDRGDDDEQHRGGRAAGEIEDGEHLPVDEGREHVGAIGRPAAGQHIDHVEDAEGVGERMTRMMAITGRSSGSMTRVRICQGEAPSTRAASSGSVGRLARPASSTRMSKGSASQRLAMTIVARASQTLANQSGPSPPKCWAIGVDHPVAVDEHEAPGERADHRRHHQRQRDDGAEEARAAQGARWSASATVRPSTASRTKLARDDARVCARAVEEVRVGGDPDVVVEADEIRRAAERGLARIEAEPDRPADRVEHGRGDARPAPAAVSATPIERAPPANAASRGAPAGIGEGPGMRAASGRAPGLLVQATASASAGHHRLGARLPVLQRLVDAHRLAT